MARYDTLSGGLRAAIAYVREQPGGRLLPILMVALGAVWAFLALTDEVIEGDTRRFDTRILLALRNPLDHADPLGPPWLEIVGRDVTALGGVLVLGLLTLAAAGYLRLSGNGRSMWFLFAAVAGGVVISQLLKLGIDRPRPDLVPFGTYAYTASFPSGHSMMATVTYLTLAVMMVRVEPRRRLKAYYLTLAILVSLAVGISRIYLGVHWPTDVLAGWTAGTAWAMACWIAARWLAHRGTIEEEPDAPETDTAETA